MQFAFIIDQPSFILPWLVDYEIIDPSCPFEESDTPYFYLPGG